MSSVARANFWLSARRDPVYGRRFAIAGLMTMMRHLNRHVAADDPAVQRLQGLDPFGDIPFE